jgi:hypothetical protein
VARVVVGRDSKRTLFILPSRDCGRSPRWNDCDTFGLHKVAENAFRWNE